MCTVTYLPKDNNQFILTSNRDEGVARARAQFPKIKNLQGTDVLFPKDIAGGSWIGITENQRAVCLLNGAFKLHKRELPYRKSRGIIVLDALTAVDEKKFINHYDLHRIEPFTLLVLDWREQLTLIELRWDGENRHVKSLDTEKPHIWSSSTLYNDQMQRLRASWFNKWQMDNEFSVTAIRAFHKNTGDGDPITNLITERGFLKTVSITTMKNTESPSSMIYEDLTLNKTEISTIQQKSTKQPKLK